MARLFNEVVFDEYLDGTTSAYTSTEWNQLLGSADTLALQAIVDNIAGTSPTLSVGVENGDGRNFGEKYGTPAINAFSLTGGSQVSTKGTDDGSVPSTQFVRLKVTLGGTNPKAHVRM